MQALCIVTADENCDVQCLCCGQKYSVYYARQDKAEREEALLLIQQALTEHHLRSPLTTAHPGDAFNVPAWSGPAHASAAALLGGAPVARAGGNKRNAPIPFVAAGEQQRRVS